METLPPDTEDTGVDANRSSVKSEDSTPPHEGGRGSPPPNCAICLGTCRNKCFTDSCLHQFCFKCLLTWSKVKAECPLCKQNFKSIIHNVRSNHQYEEYMVEQRQPEPAADLAVDLGNAARRFRYRTTLTLPRRESLAIQHLLMHYPMMAGVFPGAAGAPAAPAPAPAPAAAPAPAPLPPRRRRSPASFRRTVYRHNLWARPLPDFTGRYRDCSPDFYRRNDSQVHRLVPWLSRELHYLLSENAGHISYVMARILELLPRVPIDSREFAESVRRYFGDRTEHFLHELHCFASTPYDLTGYDRQVQYTTDARVSFEVLSSTASDSGDSDVVVVAGEPPPGPSRAPAAAVVPIETVSRSGSDDDEEVVLVGYIKPPAERTPEVVDLLGSDSDVVVHEPDPAPAPAPAPVPAPASPARDRLVKLSLTRRRAAAAAVASATDSDDGPAPPAPRPRRRRRRSALSSSSSSSSSSASRFTPEPAPPRGPAPVPALDPQPAAAASASTSPPSGASSASASCSASWSSDSDDRRRRNPKKTRRKAPRRPASRDPRPRPRAERASRKSHRGRGVKSSRRAAGSEGEGEAAAGPSRREARRLRSVVRVMGKPASESGSSGSLNLLSVLSDAILKPRSGVLAYGSDGSGPASPRRAPAAAATAGAELLRRAAHCFRAEPAPAPAPAPAPGAPASDSDPEDDLPLNLSVPRRRAL